jgi:hypothetical protein
MPPVPSWERLPADRLGRLTSALPLLREALTDAEQTGFDPWRFAVTATELFDAGLRVTDIRWLIAVGVLDHRVERTRRSGRIRTFRPATPALTVAAQSCFLLTEAGVRFHDRQPAVEVADHAGGSDRPHWDGARRELTWQGLLVKRFRNPAHCQETILAAFQEDGWPPRIDDPLTRRAGRLSSGDRLHEAVKALNRYQQAARVRFMRDGTGQGVCWAA